MQMHLYEKAHLIWFSSSGKTLFSAHFVGHVPCLHNLHYLNARMECQLKVDTTVFDQQLEVLMLQNKIAATYRW